ncbi:MAG TPA: ATP-binding protein [Patescibacteria group bacterium]|nr:ATP-binding protein [Patescibacteria group bacterium]
MDTLLTIFPNPYAIGFFLIFIANIIFAGYVYSRKRSSSERTIFWFSFLILMSGGWALGQYGLSSSTTTAPYGFWYAFTELMIVLLMPVYVCFILSFVGKVKVIERFDAVGLLVSSMTVLLYIYWKTDIITIHNFALAVKMPWGYEYPRGPVPWDLFIILFYIGYMLFELLSYYRSVKNPIERRQIGLIAFALMLPSVGGIIFQGILPMALKIPELPATPPLILLMCIIVGYTLLRYGTRVFSLTEVSADILQLIPDSLLVLDSSFCIQTANSSAAKLMGVRVENLIGKPLESLLETDAQKILWRQNVFEPLTRGQKVESVEMMFPRPAGTIIPLSVNAVARVEGEGKFSNIIMLFTDISVIKQKEQEVLETMKRTQEQNMLLEDNKRAMLNLLEDAKNLEDKLKIEKENVEKKVIERTRDLTKEQARLMASIRSLSLGFIMTNMAGKIVLMNDEAQTILGFKERPNEFTQIASALGQSVDLTNFKAACEREKTPIRVDSFQFQNKWIRLFMAPVVTQDTEAEVLGIVFIFEDISEAKVLERSRDEFFSIASHELRTPLTAIRGNTSMIQEYYKEKLPSDANEMVNDIHESSVRLITIVNDFLDMSRLEQGRMQFKNENFNIEELIKSVLKEYDVTGSREKLYLRYQPPEGAVPLVFGDPSRVKQVLINLVGNALKFTEEGGVTISILLDGRKLRVVVEDTGRGIPYENQTLLFRKFQQAGDSIITRDTTKGTGLGLYISKLMVEGMGGAIGLQYSRPGKGTAFGFSLNVAEGQDIAAGEKKS